MRGGGGGVPPEILKKHGKQLADKGEQNPMAGSRASSRK